MLPASRRIDNAWMTLEQRGTAPAELLSADIYDSWMRCISFGLDTLRPPSPEFVSPAVLRQEQQRCSLVRGLALAEMHTLHQQIAGSNFMIAFANAEGAPTVKKEGDVCAKTGSDFEQPRGVYFFARKLQVTEERCGRIAGATAKSSSSRYLF